MSDFMDRDDIILFKLGQIEAKLDQSLTAQALHIGDDKAFHADADARLKALETSRARVYGGAAVVSVIGTGMMSWLTGFLHH